MTEVLNAAARQFFSNDDNRGHCDRPAPGDAAAAVEAGLASGRSTAHRSLRLVSSQRLRVLDVGCSWGPVTIALAESGRVSAVVGVDLEAEALRLGRAVLTTGLPRGAAAEKVGFVLTPAERLPFSSDAFDLVICHTVIEHVIDVEASLREMLRVLRPGGVLHLEAPNYLWPKEPHLALWMPPLGPKWVVKQLARFSGRNAGFVDHLMFVNPYWIERILRRAGASYENMAVQKLERVVVEHAFDEVIGMRQALPFIRLLQRLRAGRAAVRLASRLGVYPSIEYAISK